MSRCNKPEGVFGEDLTGWQAVVTEEGVVWAQWFRGITIGVGDILAWSMSMGLLDGLLSTQGYGV